MFSVSIEDTVFKIRSTSMSVDDKYDIGLHSHHNFEVHCILKGEEELMTLDVATSEIKHYSVGENGIIVVPPNVYHATRAQCGFSFFSFSFDISSTKKTNDSSFFKNMDVALRNLNIPLILQDEEVNAILRRLGKYAVSPTGYLFCDTEKIQLAISRIVFNIADGVLKNSLPPSSKKPVKKQADDREFLIKEFISQRYSMPNALTELANTLHLSERQTQISVKKIMGRPFKELILEQKMTIAKMLIETTTLSLTEISENLGYVSYASFFTAYKNHFGCSPNTHRSTQSN